MALIPPVPDRSADIVGEVPLRYEDVGQEGHLLAHGMPHALGLFWRLAAPRLLGGLRGQGVVPILVRLCTEAGDAPLGIVAPLRGEGRHELAHTRDRAGEVTRILLRVWVDLHGPRARVYGPEPAGAGEEIVAGRVFAEHVFTRLFAPPEQRKVLALDASDLPAVPDKELVWSPPGSVLVPPDDAVTDGQLGLDPEPVVFAADHVDSNRHVNSLVYPRLFRDIALRHHARLGRSTATLRVLAQHTAFARPCFAGDRLRVACVSFTRGDRLGVAMALMPEPTDGPDLGRWAAERGRTFGFLELTSNDS